MDRYENCIDVIQNAINDLAKELYKEDDCKPEFLVSEDIHNRKILLTIKHCGFTHTDVIFPHGDYGNTALKYQIEQLYNSTM